MYYEEFGSSLNRSLLLSPPNQSRLLPISILPKSGKPDFGGEKTEMRGAGRSSKLVAALTPTLSLAGEREGGGEGGWGRGRLGEREVPGREAALSRVAMATAEAGQ